MSMLFGGDDYEKALQEYLDYSPMALSSDFKESCFREWWDKERGISANNGKQILSEQPRKSLKD